MKAYRADYLRESALVELFDLDSTKLLKISMTRILKWLHQVASALAYMSERHIIHTDVRKGCHPINTEIVFFDELDGNLLKELVIFYTMRKLPS